ncbi:hypothetical protein MUO79_10205 [Candidatus Bathyarchaeota archaeon]|nr:hypothetical protein [Candidatus Bathyarchaeota archaeon]
MGLLELHKLHPTPIRKLLEMEEGQNAMTQGKQISRTEYVTPKTEQEILAKAFPRGTKTTKTTKKLRKILILQSLLNGTFNRPNLITQFHCSDRAFRTDLNELAEELEEPIEDQITFLRTICAEKLMVYAATEELDPAIMAKIIIAGFSRKVELKQEITEKVDVHVTNIDTSLRDYQWALEEAARLNLQSNSKTKPLDTAQSAPEANPVPAA